MSATLQKASIDYFEIEKIHLIANAAHSIDHNNLFIRIKQDYDAIGEAWVIQELNGIKLLPLDEFGSFSQEKGELLIDVGNMKVTAFLNIYFTEYHANIMTTFYLALNFMRKPLLFTDTKAFDLSYFTFSDLIVKTIRAYNDSEFKKDYEKETDSIFNNFTNNLFDFIMDGTTEEMAIALEKSTDISNLTLLPVRCVVKESEIDIIILLYGVKGNLVGYIIYVGKLAGRLMQIRQKV